MSAIPQVNAVLHQWVRVCHDCHYHSPMPYQPVQWDVGAQPPHRPKFRRENFACLWCGCEQDVSPDKIVWVPVDDATDPNALTPIICSNCQHRQIAYTLVRSGWHQTEPDMVCVNCKHPLWELGPYRVGLYYPPIQPSSPVE